VLWQKPITRCNYEIEKYYLAGIILLMLAFVISPVNAEADNATTNSTNIDSNSSDVLAAGEEQLVDDIEPDESIISPDSVFLRF